MHYIYIYILYIYIYIEREREREYTLNAYLPSIDRKLIF